jgi:hypothetical protein
MEIIVTADGPCLKLATNGTRFFILIYLTRGKSLFGLYRIFGHLARIDTRPCIRPLLDNRLLNLSIFKQILLSFIKLLFQLVTNLIDVS